MRCPKTWLRLLKLAFVCGAASLLAAVAAAETLSVSRTPDGIQRKAVVTSGQGRLFETASGSSGVAVSMTDVFFILEGAGAGSRTPVSKSPDSPEVDGWLDNDSFAAWDTSLAIDFAPRGAGRRAEIFDSSRCAILSRSGAAPLCKPAGVEPETMRKSGGRTMLVPVFGKEGEGPSTVYEGGFVRVTPGGADQLGALPSSRKGAGYDLVLVMDSTSGNGGPFFKATRDAIEDFVSQAVADVGQEEVRESIRIGLLFYQDRKIGTECTLDYLTQWRVQLSATSGIESIDAVKAALAKEQEATCGSDEAEEAVFDGLIRALQDTDWKDGTFRVIALIGDADPHWDTSAAHYEKKNPMHFTVRDIQRKADEKNVRFIATRVADATESTTQFEPLAMDRAQQALVGRFNRVADPIQLRQALAASLLKDWRDIVKTERALVTGTSRSAVPTFDHLVIVGTPDAAPAPGGAAFFRGWVPQEILGKTVMNPYVFMTAARAGNLIRVIDQLAGQLEGGQAQASEVFMDILRNVVAADLNVSPDEAFSSGETLAGLLRKAKILPFETGILRFTATEINQWHSEDYLRVINIVRERNEALREYVSAAGRVTRFGEVNCYFVPLELMP
jgi:hypothetical protein